MTGLAAVRTLCLHGHFYQPPREHPWLGALEPEPSAAPWRDWNGRITAECYAPNAAARILDAKGRLRELVNAYEWTSFDFGPTLLTWLVAEAPAVMAALVRADAASRARTGHGNAWAQAYGHAILPLSTARDVRTQVLWGRRDFEHRFGRAPEGMWLPEMAVDVTSLEALAEAGISLTMLAPHQARRVRPLEGGNGWQEVTAETLDTRRLYRCALPSGRSVDVLFRDAALSHEVAFGGLLADGTALAARLRGAVEAAGEGAVVALAADGETYGHHHRFGEMALAFALERLRAEGAALLTNPAAFRALQPPQDEVEIAEGTSWSCAHGVERWRADCGCRVGGAPGSSQAWRAPLREAIDWLRDRLAPLYEEGAGTALRDPWGARDRYIECLLEPARRGSFVAAEAAGPLSAAGALRARQALEMARHALFMQTSCGWFFDELTGLEPRLVLRHAARAIELAAHLGGRFEQGFAARLERARGAGTADGAALYRRLARAAAATPARVGATTALLRALGCAGELPGYDVTVDAPVGGRVRGVAAVEERATGALARVAVETAPGPDGVGVARADAVTFGAGDLFPVQREMLAAHLGGQVTEGMRRVLDAIRPVLAPLIAAETPLPSELAGVLAWAEAVALGEELDGRASARALAAGVTALRARGVGLPAAWLGPRIARAVEALAPALPASAAEAIALLDLAKAAGVEIDLGAAQVAVLAWWKAGRPAEPPPALLALAARLDLAVAEVP